MSANQILTINMITREAVELFRNTSSILTSLDSQYSDLFVQEPRMMNLTLSQALAFGAAAAIIKNPTVSRRFWARLKGGD